MRKLTGFLVVLLIACSFISNVRETDATISEQDSTRLSPGSRFINSQGTSDIDVILNDNLYSEMERLESLSFQLYVTPEAPAITEMASRINDLQETYQAAVRWVYVSERTLNNENDKWLTPQEFLTVTPQYPNNPLKEQEVSDCEEQANTLVSLLRVQGVTPDEVRVGVGHVLINNQTTGHVWVELFTDEKWLVLDPTCGPYWDDETNKLVQRKGLPFHYYASHDYPILKVWIYYNDIYYLLTEENAGNVPKSWF